MQKLGIIFLFFFLGSCQNKDKSPFLFFGDGFSESPIFQFQYGNAEEEGNLVENTSSISFESGVLCLHSLPISLYVRELGAKFRICWKTSIDVANQWKEGFLHLTEDSNEYPTWNWKGKGAEAVLTEYGKWKKDSDKEGFLLEWNSQIWSSGLTTYQTFAIHHPLFLQRTKDECEVIFSTQTITGSPNKRPILSLVFPCPDLNEISELIQTQNDKWFSECVPGEPNVSELFRHSESSYQRFLEWENPKETVICPRSDSLDWVKDGIRKSFRSELFSKRTKLILPHGMVLFSDDPGLFSIPIPKEFLTDLGTQTSVLWGNTDYHDSEFIFRQGTEFFSNQTNSISCRNQYNFWNSKDLFCGNPGLPNQLEKKIKEDRPPSCQAKQIQITEFYPGNHFESQFPIPAFFEFQNTGETCDGSSLQWVFENTIYPLSAEELILPKGAIFLITRKLWSGWNLLEKEKPFSIPKVVYQIPNFHWENRNDKERVSYTNNPTFYHLLRLNTQNRYSIVVDSFGEHPHTRTLASSALLAYGFQMSPGSFNVGLVDHLFTELLEYNPNQSPFLDFGFTGFEEGVVSFQRENGNTYLFWKPSEVRFQTLATSPSPCNGDGFYQLPDGFFSENFYSLRYLSKEKGQSVVLSWDPKSIKERTLGGTHSLHPEPSPIFFSRSILASDHCISDFRSPGKEKHRSLEISRWDGEFTYLTNFPLGTQTEVRLGNNSNTIPLSLQTSGTNIYLVNSGGPFPFSIEEQLYSYFSDPSLIQPRSFLERKGPVQIEAIFPNPKDSQNEWIYLCNRSENPEDMSSYLVEDEASTDELTSYQSRFPNLYPFVNGGKTFELNSTILYPGHCAWVVDPDGKDWVFPIFQKDSDLLLTIKTTQTIGNGISSGESIQLRKKIGQISKLISSFGHKESFSPFRIPVTTGEFLWLKTGSDGMSPEDFEIYREEF
ncbi:lamin tail domain-containing protein [Leptospira sp. 2 VSF19]|uniref:Lamin tail domain-containing protein n=1 Tax=Leptospira soteropolitanensis TaxID=2950025 RepID=A0AAW5VNF6_9LEPT|nr:lamin tail domain-containing protein [Leptospira soteropolitanensis]MCW7493112.1 lamin tail domain-containing protein [Leptospira soteropolitanensis]MCW7500819.1 lamin tail domain-containing protein [Leptospira soteropolitanensis]MCW7522962.1 lamin tail domain-containing protein [Leptospira soteropolitanensis]MCW7526931.1 lamin tail domain-containing protein [Leptospira soteropolitanensis]MCW7530680.1 lamin tail domain-containing protein [Leptospira soteropolitanensis]